MRAFWPVALVGLVATLMLFWKLDARYLWQDEAACAEMSTRMFEGGRPLAYDGTNLITMDEFSLEEGRSIAERTHSAEAALDYYLEKGDFKADTSWIGQPWGQFVLAGASMQLFGKDTFQARLPFAIGAVLTVLALFLFVRRRLGSQWMAFLAAALLLTNTYWFLHVRQCRYYSPSSLFLLLSVISYFRWQALGRMRDGVLFTLTAWAYFQSDFGSFWPVMGVLFVDRMLAERGRWRSTLGFFAALGLSVLPFIFFYEMYGRLKENTAAWYGRLSVLGVWVNQFQLPLLALLAVPWLLRRGGANGRPVLERRIVLVACGIVLAQLAWMTAVSPFPFYRYVVDMTPLSCLVVAFVVVQLARRVVPRARGITGALLAAVVLFTPWATHALGWAIPVSEIYAPLIAPSGTWLRKDLEVLAMDLAANTPDPNRRVIEYLRTRIQPGDEVLINYEDAPLMFYLDNPIRGGISCFRAEVSEGRPPRFLVLRSSVGFTHAAVYQREIRRHRWIELDVDAPDMTWGNSPDPWGHYSRSLEQSNKRGNLKVLENAFYADR